jgi:hypothetical protein
MRSLGLALAITAALCLLVPALDRLAFAERRVPLAPARDEGKRVATTLELSVFARLPDDALLLEDGAPLPFPRAPRGEIASVGSGRYAIEGGARVLWSSPDGTDPLANGRRYELAFTPNVIGSRAGWILFLTTCALLALAWRAGALAFAPWDTRRRAALALATALLLAIGFARRWDAVLVQPDSTSYVLSLSSRTVLYPGFVDVLAGGSRPEKEALAARIDAAIPREGGYQRFEDEGLLRVVRAQKALTVLAIALLVFVLAGTLDGWLVAALVFASVLVDSLRGSDAQVAFNLSVVESEGTNHALVFLYLAALLAFSRTPGWSRGVALSLVVSLLLLNRPANAPLAIGYVLVLAVELSRGQGWKRALTRTVALGLIALVPVGAEAGGSRARTGFAKLHAYTGASLIGMPLQVAEPEDALAFDEPDLREFVRRCTVDLRDRKIQDPFACNAGEYVGTNIFLIAMPASAALEIPPEQKDVAAWVQDDKLARVARKLIARHPRAYLALVLDHFSRLLSWKWHGGALVAFAAALWLWRRTRARDYLFGAFFAALPFVAMAPTCLVNYPAERYRSQLYFAEVLALPFLACVFATRRQDD